MKMLFVFLFLFAVTAHANSDQAFRAFWKRPSAKSLKTFKKSCDTNDQLDFDGGTVGQLARQAEKKASVLKVRALLFAEEHCTDGGSQESLRTLLGNEILLKHAALLIEAVAAEKTKDLAGLLTAENRDWYGSECENNQCRDERKAYFAKKTAAIQAAKIKKSLEPARQALLVSSWANGK
ncbi:MAG: hypothetical protein ACXWQO_14210 [Bdellovibrionota bacterium]